MHTSSHLLMLISPCLSYNHPRLRLFGPGACSGNPPVERPMRHSRQGFVVVNGVGHPKEFLHCVHHFGRFCSQQFAIQDQNLEERKREKGDLNLFSLQGQAVPRLLGQQPSDKVGSLHSVESASSSTFERQVTSNLRPLLPNCLLSAGLP